jgi:iron complex outermembrane recepter protein
MTKTRPASASPGTARINARIAAAIALALSAAQGAQAVDADDSLQEVVVTANRREQNLLDVPYNISTASGAEMQAAGVSDLTDIGRLFPGMNIPDLGPRANSSNSNIVIRGLNANDPSGTAYLPWESVPLVSTYVDEVPLFVNLTMTDVQRVEVLRGPQGTLYGSGAVAGTIRIIHNQPDPSQFAADVSVDAADTSHAANGSYATSGMLNIPVTDAAAIRMNAGYKETSGFINANNAVVFGPDRQPVLADPSDPLTSGFVTQSLHDIDRALSEYERISALWHVTSAIDATFAFQRQDDRSDAFSREEQGQNYVDNVLIPIAPDHRVVDLDALTLTADIGFATVTSSTSYARNQDTSYYDESAFILQFTGAPTYYGNYPRATTEFITSYTDSSTVEELRLVSKEGHLFDYTVGAFFRHENNDLFQDEPVPGFGAWSALPGSANAVNEVLGTDYANFDDYIQQYNGGTPPSADVPTDSVYTYARRADDARHIQVADHGWCSGFLAGRLPGGAYHDTQRRAPVFHAPIS